MLRWSVNWCIPIFLYLLFYPSFFSCGLLITRPKRNKKQQNEPDPILIPVCLPSFRFIFIMIINTETTTLFPILHLFYIESPQHLSHSYQFTIPSLVTAWEGGWGGFKSVMWGSRWKHKGCLGLVACQLTFFVWEKWGCCIIKVLGERGST